MSEKTLQEIEKEIAETQAELANVHGDDCEVYARIVGILPRSPQLEQGQKRRVQAKETLFHKRISRTG